MTLVYDASVPAVPQSGAWQCSAASTAWLLDALGAPTTQDDVVAALGPNRIDPNVGLHDATGAGLVAMLSDPYQVGAANAAVSFDDALALAASEPFLLGGVGWDHWSGVRSTDGSVLQLANPSPGWKGVGSTMSRGQFDQLGPFYAVWPTDVVSSPNPGSPPSNPPTAASTPPRGLSDPPRWALVAGVLAAIWALDL